MRNKIFFLTVLIIIITLASFGYFSFFKKPSDPIQNGTTLNKSEPRYKLVEINPENVDQTWKAFAEQHIERMRQIEAKTPSAKLPGYKFDRVFVEIKSPFISRFLPNYQIYTEQYFTFAFNVTTKEVTNIANGWGGAVGYNPYYRDQEFSNFIKNQKIQATNKQGAIDFLKLVEDIYRWSDSDNLIYWELKAKKDGGIWVVQSEYIGPPEYSIIVPPVWEVVVDAQGYITEVRQRRERF